MCSNPECNTKCRGFNKPSTQHPERIYCENCMRRITDGSYSKDF